MRISYTHRFTIGELDIFPTIDFNQYDIVGNDEQSDLNEHDNQWLSLYSSMGLGLRTNKLTGGIYFTHFLEFVKEENPIHAF